MSRRRTREQEKAMFAKQNEGRSYTRQYTEPLTAKQEAIVDKQRKESYRLKEHFNATRSGADIYDTYASEGRLDELRALDYYELTQRFKKPGTEGVNALYWMLHPETTAEEAFDRLKRDDALRDTQADYFTAADVQFYYARTLSIKEARRLKRMAKKALTKNRTRPPSSKNSAPSLAKMTDAQRSQYRQSKLALNQPHALWMYNTLRTSDALGGATVDEVHQELARQNRHSSDSTPSKTYVRKVLTTLEDTGALAKADGAYFTTSIGRKACANL